MQYLSYSYARYTQKSAEYSTSCKKCLDIQYKYKWEFVERGLQIVQGR